MGRRLGIFKRFGYAQLFLGAREDIIRGKYHDAMNKVDGMFKAYGLDKPSVDAPIKANIMCGLAAWNLREFDLVYRSCRVALDQIAAHLNGKIDGGLRNELKYLRSYVRNLVVFADHEGGVSKYYDFSDIADYKFGEVDLSKVKSLTKSTFPVDSRYC
jgi:hypothetical protein